MVTTGTISTGNTAILLDSDDLAALLGFKGSVRQKRKAVYGLLQKEGEHFGVFHLNGRLVCHRAHVLARLEELAQTRRQAA
jgi:hypothetical protein